MTNYLVNKKVIFKKELWKEWQLIANTFQKLSVPNLSLYIDSTGGVVRKPSKMNGKVFYCALVLPSAKRGRPSLRVAKMLSNSHTVPDVSSFKKKLLYSKQRFSKLLSYKLRRTSATFSFLVNVMNNELLEDYINRLVTLTYKLFNK